MDTQDSGAQITYLTRDRDLRYPTSFEPVLAEQGVKVVKTGVRMPRMNTIMERWIRSFRAELPDRTLIWHQAHLMHALREYEKFHNEHRTHRALTRAAPLRPLPQPLTSERITHLDIRRHDRLRGTLHEYHHTA